VGFQFVLEIQQRMLSSTYELTTWAAEMRTADAADCAEHWAVSNKAWSPR